MIKLKISRSFVGLFFVLYSVFIVAFVFSLNFSRWIFPQTIILLGVALVFMLSFTWIFFQQSKWQGLLISENSSDWRLWDNRMNVSRVSLVPGSYCSHFMIILNFVEKKRNKKISLIILRDSLLVSEYKKLKIVLLG